MRRLKPFMTCVLFLLIANVTSATTARVRQLSAEEADMLVQNLQKIVIEEDADQNIRMSIIDLTGAVLMEQQINSSAKITFEEESVNVETAIESVPEPSPVSVYPNPAVDYIHIVGLQDNDIVRIFNLQGYILIEEKGADVNVSSLTTGTYILLVGKQCFKVIIE